MAFVFTAFMFFQFFVSIMHCGLLDEHNAFLRMSSYLLQHSYVSLTQRVLTLRPLTQLDVASNVHTMHKTKVHRSFYFVG